jgi:hypothetical protein
MPVDGDAIMGPDALRFGSRVFQRDPPLAEWILFQLGEQVMNLWGSADLCENANTRGQIAMAPDVINARVVGIMMLRLVYTRCGVVQHAADARRCAHRLGLAHWTAPTGTRAPSRPPPKVSRPWAAALSRRPPCPKGAIIPPESFGEVQRPVRKKVGSAARQRTVWYSCRKRRSLPKIIWNFGKTGAHARPSKTPP